MAAAVARDLDGPARRERRLLSVVGLEALDPPRGADALHVRRRPSAAHAEDPPQGDPRRVDRGDPRDARDLQVRRVLRVVRTGPPRRAAAAPARPLLLRAARSVSYLVDLYRGDVPVSDAAPPSYAALRRVSSPHLIAGPIVRACRDPTGPDSSASPQPGADSAAASPRARSSCSPASPPKVLVADNARARSPTPPSPSPSADSSTEASTAGGLGLRGSDSSATSPATPPSRDRRLALMLRLPTSPRTSPIPYLSRLDAPSSGSRWHMTLSRWLRDYLYIPLGGNRGKGPSTRLRSQPLPHDDCSAGSGMARGLRS